MGQVNMRKRLLTFVLKLTGPPYFSQDKGPERLVKGCGTQRHHTRLIIKRESWHAAPVPHHFREDCSGAEGQPFARNFHPRIKAVTLIPFLQNLLPRLHLKPRFESRKIGEQM
jgi:hypothetical protein